MYAKLKQLPGVPVGKLYIKPRLDSSHKSEALFSACAGAKRKEKGRSEKWKALRKRERKNEMASSKKKNVLRGIPPNAANADDDDSVDYIGKNGRNRQKTRTEVRRYFKIYYPPQNESYFK